VSFLFCHEISKMRTEKKKTPAVELESAHRYIQTLPLVTTLSHLALNIHINVIHSVPSRSSKCNFSQEISPLTSLIYFLIFSIPPKCALLQNLTYLAILTAPGSHRSSHFWGVTQHSLAVTYRSYLTLKDGTDRWSRNVAN
jgi:hypothetical protein